MIYKEIEDADKVFGRTTKISTGSFSDGFQLDSFHIDSSASGELDTPLSCWIKNDCYESGPETATGKTADELYNDGCVVSDAYEQQINSSYTDEEVGINLIATNEYHTGHWTEVSYGDYYANVYNQPTTSANIVNENAELQFSITYGHKMGWGSRLGGRSVSVTKAIYNQYKNILLGPGDEEFTFTKSGDLSGASRDSIYVINFASARIKEKLDEGNVEFTLKMSQSGKEVIRTFRDDSRYEAQTLSATGQTKTGRVFNIIKGGIADGPPTDDHKYAQYRGDGHGEGFGLLYPDLGIIILNPYALACEFGGRFVQKFEEYEDGENPDPTTVTNPENNVGRKLAWYGDIAPTEEESDELIRGTERNHQNFLKLFYALKAGQNFRARSTEYIPSKHYFIRVRNSDFNYSNNPTYVYQNQEAIEQATLTSSEKNYWLGRVRHEEFVNDPKTYLTTIGLYNENNELVAVAKLSVPVLKSFDTETLIKVKLDF